MSSKKPIKPRNPYIQFCSEWGPTVADLIRVEGGSSSNYNKEMSEKWNSMKNNNTSAYQNYVNRTKKESATYQRRKELNLKN